MIVAAKSHDITSAEAMHETIAWNLIAAKHVDQGDQVLEQARREAVQLPPASQFFNQENMAEMLAYRGKYDQAFAAACTAKNPLSVEPLLARLVLIAFDNADSKGPSKLASLVSTRWKAKPPMSDESGMKVIRALAEAGAISDARALLTQLTGSKVPGTQSDLDQGEMEIDIWAHDFNAADALQQKSHPAAPAGRRRASGSDGGSAGRLARAYAMADRESDARKLLAQCAGNERDLALQDVITCAARNGNSDVAQQDLLKLNVVFKPRAIEKLAQGWAVAKDTIGLSAWIETLDPADKAVAELGAAEGLMRTEARDVFKGPTWRRAGL